MSKKNFRIERLPEEGKQQLIECVESLVLDSEAYDKGMFNMIKRSSATLRMLFYDSRTSHSLINQIGSKDSLKMYSFINYPIKQEIFFGSIYCARFWASPPKIGHYDTFLFSPQKDRLVELSFDSWWNGTIFRVGKDSDFSRGKIIVTLANQDGGAHFDPTIDSNYNSLVKGTTGFQIPPKSTNHIIFGGSPDYNDQPVQFKDIHLAIMRQVVHETILSLIENFSLKINYKPNFEYNWERKLNPIAFHFSAERNN